MAVEIYVVLQPFEFENRMLVRGEEIACRSREGEDLVKAGKVVRNLRQLDPDTKKDKALTIKNSTKQRSSFVTLAARA
jgi:hypothetical protein